MTTADPVGHFQGILPAPATRRADDFVFVSSIHPIDPDGRLARSTAASPWVGESEVATQARAALGALARVLREAGSSIERVLKIELQLADPADFTEWKHVCTEVFPTDPPASTIIVVGDEHLVAGTRLSVHAVALAADSRYERTVVRPAGGPDLLRAEHASPAIVAGPFVFCSGLTASDYATGLATRGPTRSTYHGDEVTDQVERVLQTLDRTLDAAGTDLTQAVKVQFYETDLSTFPTVDRLWGDRVGIAPTRSSMGCRGFLTPEAVWMPNLLALVPHRGLEKRETRAGIPWHPVDAGKANFSPGIRAGDWLFTAGQIPVPDIDSPGWIGAPAGLPYHWSDIELQTEATMELIGSQLTANGFALEDIVDARIYLVDPRRDFRGFARVWDGLFDGLPARPAMTVIPSRQSDGSAGVMVKGPTVEIDLISFRQRS